MAQRRIDRPHHVVAQTALALAGGLGDRLGGCQSGIDAGRKNVEMQLHIDGGSRRRLGRADRKDIVVAPIIGCARDKLKPIAGAPYDRRNYNVFSVGPAQAAAGPTIYMQLHLDVFPPGIDATLAAAKAVAEAARKGEGSLRYDVVRSVNPPLSHTTLFAAWQSRKAFDAYESSPSARQFRDTVGPLLGSPSDDRLPMPIH